MAKTILYVGPSWAKRNFELNDSSRTDLDLTHYTNIKKECQIDAIDLAEYGASNIDMLKKIKKYKGLYDGIIWIYCEPILDLEILNIASKLEFLTSNNFWKLRDIANSLILEEIDSLNKPVALVGAHSDIFGADKFLNLTVVHNSWQQFLVDCIKYDYLDGWSDRQGWGAEIAHKWMHELGISPATSLVNKINEMFFIWSLLQNKDLFFEVHPNKNATILFANEIKSKLNSWIKQI